MMDNTTTTKSVNEADGDAKTKQVVWMNGEQQSKKF